MPLTESFGNSWCCTATVYSHVYGRLLSGARVRSGATPKAGFELGPISLSCAMSSPFVDRVKGEHVEVPGRRSQSNQLRVSVWRPAGEYRFAYPTDSR